VFGGSENALDLHRIGIGIGGRAGPVDGEVIRRFRPQLRRAGLKRVAGVGPVTKSVPSATRQDDGPTLNSGS